MNTVNLTQLKSILKRFKEEQRHAEKLIKFTSDAELAQFPAIDSKNGVKLFHKGEVAAYNHISNELRSIITTLETY